MRNVIVTSGGRGLGQGRRPASEGHYAIAARSTSDGLPAGIAESEAEYPDALHFTRFDLDEAQGIPNSVKEERNDRGSMHALRSNGSMRETIERRMQEVLAGHDPAQGREALIAGVRAAFGVPAEGLPFSDPALATPDGMCRLIEANVEPSPLVACLQPEGANKPLFLIHAGGGYVFFYRALASRLAPDHPVLAIRAETDADHRGHRFDRWKSLEELAAHYIALIKEVQPEGPYSIGGGSLGGVIAFEMARQLRASGDSVRSVLLFCPELLTGQRAAEFMERRLAQRVASHLSTASQLEPRQAVRYVSTKILNTVASNVLELIRWIREQSDGGKQHGVKPEPLSPELTFRSIVNMRASVRLLMKYKPQPYEGSIALFRGAQDRDPLPDWKDLARGGLDLYDAPGGHLKLLEEPIVGSIAEIVKPYLRSV